MSKWVRFFLILLSILLIARRSPAPIVEEENATPAPAQEATKQSPKTKRKSAETSEPTRSETRQSSKPHGFAGTWSGKVNNEIMANIPCTLTFASGVAQVTEHTNFGTYSHPITSDGHTATWKSGVLNEIVWTFTPNSDGNTAHVTVKSPLGVNGDSTFHRGGTPVVVKAPSEFPTAKPVPEKPGFVYNPFDPTSRIFIDVRGKPSGTKLTDPKSGKTFIVP